MLPRTLPYLVAVVGLFGLLGPLDAGTSNSLIDVSPDGALLLVTNSDNGTVTVVDTAGPKAVREIAVGDDCRQRVTEPWIGL